MVLYNKTEDFRNQCPDHRHFRRQQMVPCCFYSSRNPHFPLLADFAPKELFPDYGAYDETDEESERALL
jgi:hypothetical protein